jgi:hypothetical protein
MITFSNYLTDRRYLTSNLSGDAWLFVIFALGDPRYQQPGSWTDLKRLLQDENVSSQLQRGAFRVWQSYLRWRRRKREPALRAA